MFRPTELSAVCDEPASLVTAMFVLCRNDVCFAPGQRVSPGRLRRSHRIFRGRAASKCDSAKLVVRRTSCENSFENIASARRRTLCKHARLTLPTTTDLDCLFPELCW